MALHNPNNWHWVNKDVQPWTEDWLKSIVGLEATNDGGVTAKIQSLSSSEGDCEVSQRKGKLIAIYDLKVVYDFEGTTADGSTCTGTLTFNEVSHSSDRDDLLHNPDNLHIDLKSEAPKDQVVKTIVRNQLVPQIVNKLLTLCQTLLEEHGKDIQHAPGTELASAPSTAKVVSRTIVNKESKPASASTATDAQPQRAGNGALVNTTTITDSVEFRTDAQSIYNVFTKPDLLAAFTRSPPLVFEGAKPDGKFALFGGNVSGSYVELKEPTQIVQKWRLKEWPDNHYSTMTLDFVQNNADGVTDMELNWTGVPIGHQEAAERKWKEYYVMSIKRTFGFGTVL